MTKLKQDTCKRLKHSKYSSSKNSPRECDKVIPWEGQLKVTQNIKHFCKINAKGQARKQFNNKHKKSAKSIKDFQNIEGFRKYVARPCLPKYLLRGNHKQTEKVSIDSILKNLHFLIN